MGQWIREADLRQFWIKVTDQQPPTTDQFIGYDKLYGYIGQAQYAGWTGIRGRPVYEFLGWPKDDCHITHWMPLPDAPEGG